MRRPFLQSIAYLTATAAVIGLAPLARLASQSSASPQQQASARPAARGTKVLNLSEYGHWNRIASALLSPDGKWATYTYAPNDGSGTLYARQLDGDKVYTADVGALSGGQGPGGGGQGAASGPVFSDDSRWLGYYVNPPEQRGARGGGGRGRGGNTPAQIGRGGQAAATRRFELLDLATGEKFPVPDAASFKFGKGGHWLAVRINHPAQDTTHTGADLLLRDLTSRETRDIGNVNLYDFDDAGRFLAYTVDAAEHLGNGIYLVDLTTGASHPLNSAAQTYDQLAWSDGAANLAVLRGEKTADRKQRDNVLMAWTDLEGGEGRAIQYDPSKDAAFPKGLVLSELAAPRWSKDGSRIFVGLKDQEAEPPKTDEPQANVDVWHWKDADPQSVQMVRLAQDRRFTYAAALLVPSARLVRLADQDMRTVQAVPNGKWGIGRLETPYRGEVAWGGSRADYFRVSTETGDRTLIDKGLTRTLGVSPDSRWFLYLKDKRLRAFNLENGQSVSVDGAAGKSFVNDEDDHPYEKPAYGVAGWSKDSGSVIVYDKYDLWKLPLDGGKAVNLSGGAGAAQGIEFRLVRLDRPGRRGRGGGGGFGAAPTDEEEAIDLSKPLLLSATGEWTKKSGYWRLEEGGGKPPTPLLWEDKGIGQVQKAAQADRVIFTQQTFSEFPDYWVSDVSFASPRKFTDANPQLADYAWGSKVLIDYKNSKGQRLQGTLTLPAGYEPGKRYPMLVYFYEIMSNTHHQFSMPVYDDRPHISTYASNGYLVFQPDVVYEIGKPGTSAVDCVTSAVKKVIDLGYADPKHIGLQGHSWGGYQSSYIVTQTDMFAAVVTGAPPTNLVSFYDELYKSTGTVQQGIMELGQVRMGVGVTPWSARELYESQSPVHNVQKIKTPFLILQGTDDGAVDWDQGLEYFNAARRNGKQVIFLSYPGEGHHLAKKENQKDFQVRMKQFFDHYLKDAPEPKWMADGVSQLKKGGPIE